jgi:hypothetical protein
MCFSPHWENCLASESWVPKLDHHNPTKMLKMCERARWHAWEKLKFVSKIFLWVDIHKKITQLVSAVSFWRCVSCRYWRNLLSLLRRLHGSWCSACAKVLIGFVCIWYTPTARANIVRHTCGFVRRVRVLTTCCSILSIILSGGWRLCSRIHHIPLSCFRNKQIIVYISMN